ncbi:hypothetical protein KHU1_1006 [Bacillus amyloliquefaciens KHG19]|nr:hypothetical protein KHU1_1006 [Bacillus amyloliquefaciens KHG19]
MINLTNSNQYIEAAKIAAEAASKNTELTLKVSIVAAIIALLGTGISAYISYRSSRRTTLIETISAQRIQWVNRLRDKFVEFNKLINEFSYSIYESVEKKYVTTFDYKTKFHDLRAVGNHISLLLNPNENYSEELSNEIKKMFDILLEQDAYKVELYQNCYSRIELIQQVILKAEWKRIKEETKKGRELTESEIEKIYNEKAISMNLI